MENKVKVSIYGDTYSIQGDAAPEYIERVARMVNERMEEVGQGLSSATPLKVAILAALNIADEYMQLKEFKTGLSGELEQKTRQLISLLDEGLIGDVFAVGGALRPDSPLY